MYESIGASPVEWAGKTYEEILARADRDGSVLVVPVASLEQHGRHMPTITDTLLCSAVAQTGAERAAADDDVPVLLTPPVWSGQSRHHLPFGGTASLDSRTLLSVLEHVADTTLENGFDAILLVNGHGGNVSLLGSAVGEIGEQQDAEVLGVTYFQLAGEEISEIRESDIGGIAHAGELETSMLLHLRPDLVDEERAEGTPYDKPYDGEREDLLDSGVVAAGRPFSEYTESGAAGAPELATAEKGERFFETYCGAFADLLVEVHEENR